MPVVPRRERLCKRASIHQYCTGCCLGREDRHSHRRLRGRIQARVCRRTLSLEVPSRVLTNPGAEYGRQALPAELSSAARKYRSERTASGYLGGKRHSAGSEVHGAIALGVVSRISPRRLRFAADGLLKLCAILLTIRQRPNARCRCTRTPFVVSLGTRHRKLTGPGLPVTRAIVVLKIQCPCSPCFCASARLISVA